MADLELSIYTVTLKQKRIRDGYQNFEEFFRDNFISEKEVGKNLPLDTLYERFIGVIIDEFDNKFKLNKDGTKGFSPAKLKYRPGRDIIEGFINGGTTGRDHFIYENIDSSKSTGQLSKKDLAALPFYFKMWTPPNSHVCVVMIQNYGIGSITRMVMDFLKDVFSKYNMMLTRNLHTPKALREEFLKTSSVRMVKHVTTVQDSNTRNNLNRAYDDSDQLKVTVTVERIKNNRLKTFYDKWIKSEPINIPIPELGMINEDDYQTTIFYEDKHGRKASAKSNKSREIRPTIILPLEIQNSNRTPNLDQISKFTDEMLEQVKIDIDYK